MTKRILVVDDDIHSREGLRDTLLGEGYGVETSPDSWQAIRKIKEGRFDLAIIDFDLPTVHGVAVTAWDLARIFRAYNPEILIIVIGAEESKAIRAQAQQLRISEFLMKPINPPQLKAIVRTLEPTFDETPVSGTAGIQDNPAGPCIRRRGGRLRWWWASRTYIARQGA